MSSQMRELAQNEKVAIENFPKIAQEFCLFIDQCETNERGALVQGLVVHLARLCEIAICLPSVSPVSSDIEFNQEDISSHSKEQWNLSERLRMAFGNLDGYWEVFDPTQKEEPVNGSLARDIAEIYLDLKDAIKLMGTGANLNDVHWQWRFDFRQHWGRHAVSALRVLLHISDLA
jgi:Domain of unknown function (DUF5063)